MAKSKGKSKNGQKSDKNIEQVGGNKSDAEIKVKQESDEEKTEVGKDVEDDETPEHPPQNRRDSKGSGSREMLDLEESSESGSGFIEPAGRKYNRDRNTNRGESEKTCRNNQPPRAISGQSSKYKERKGKQGSGFNETSQKTQDKDHHQQSSQNRYEDSEDKIDTADKEPLEDTSQQRKPEHFSSNRSFKGNKERYDQDRKPRFSEPIKIGAYSRESNENPSRPRRSVYTNEDVRDTGRRYGDDRRNRREDSNFEFSNYEKEFRKSNGKLTFERTNEIERDLFEMPKEYSLAHCVAEDMGMGSGIAVHFRNIFKRVPELLNQGQLTGGLAVLEDDSRYIYYLVTKKHSTGKPSYRTLFSSLQKLKEHVKEHSVQKLAMPRIGCGLDRLDWDNVKFMIEFIFKDVNVDIVVCNLQQTEGSPQSRHRNCKQVNVPYHINAIEEGTIIVYLSSEDGHVTEEMKLLDEKFHFLTDLRYHRKNLGDTVIFTKNERYLLAGCIVRKRHMDSIDFVALRECVATIDKTNNKKGFSYIGFQAIKDERDSCVNYKIINILRNTLHNVEVYICWPEDLQQEMSSRDRFSESFTAAATTTNSSSDSAQKPYRQDSFSWKDKRRTDNEGGDWRNNSRTSTRKSEPYQKNYSESSMRSNRDDENLTGKSVGSSCPKDVTEEHWGEESKPQNTKQYEKPKTSSDEEKDWFQEAGSTKQSKKKETQSVREKRGNSFERTKLKRKDELSDETVSATFSQNTLNENCEYEKYKQESTSGNFTKVKITNNSPNLPETYSQVCYVTEDMCLQSAIPSGTNIGPFLGQLLNQNRKEGSCASIKAGKEYLYCLIVKKLHNSTYKNEQIFASLQNLKTQTAQHRVKKLVIPVMKDDLFDWSEVPSMLEFLFKNTQVDIIVAPFSHERYLESLKKRNNLTLIHAKHPLFQMKKKSMIIYWASQDGAFSEDMIKLKGKFDFEEGFQKDKKSMGSVVRHKQNEEHVLYGCIVKKTLNGLIDFDALQRCISVVSDTNTEKLSLAAASAIENEDEAVNYKIIHVLVNNLQNVTLSLCWSGNLREKMPPKNL